MQTQTHRLFGSARRTEILLLLALLEESYPSELARVLGARVYSVQSILDGLEREGVVTTQRLGRMRQVTLNPRYRAARELRALLTKLGHDDPALVDAVARRRPHPIRQGKPSPLLR